MQIFTIIGHILWFYKTLPSLIQDKCLDCLRYRTRSDLLSGTLEPFLGLPRFRFASTTCVASLSFAGTLIRLSIAEEELLDSASDRPLFISWSVRLVFSLAPISVWPLAVLRRPEASQLE